MEIWILHSLNADYGRLFTSFKTMFGTSSLIYNVNNLMKEQHDPKLLARKRKALYRSSLDKNPNDFNLYTLVFLINELLVY